MEGEGQAVICHAQDKLWVMRKITRRLLIILRMIYTTCSKIPVEIPGWMWYTCIIKDLWGEAV